MIRLLLALSVILSSITANAGSLTEANMDWLTQYPEQVQESLSNADSPNFIPNLNTILALWQHRDGGITGEVSPYLVQGIITAPDLVLGALEAYPESYSRWLKQLSGQVFTAIDPAQVEPLNQMKLALESALASYIILPDASHTESAKRLLEQVQATTVYMVD
jgi:hypothetical protein